MFTKDELKEIRAEFWEKFRVSIDRERSATGRRKNWLHYRSNIKDLYFRLDVTASEAFLAIDIQMKDDGVKDIVWEQFMETKKLLMSYIGEEMECLPSYSLTPELSVHRMKWTLPGVSLFEEKDHTKIIAFLKEKMKGLDEFWAEFFDLFYALCS